MSEVQESSHFMARKAQSLNALLNNQAPYNTWNADIRYTEAANTAYARMCMKLNEGVLLHARENRMKQLERTVANTCYSAKNDFSFLEA